MGKSSGKNESIHRKFKLRNAKEEKICKAFLKWRNKHRVLC